MEGDEEMQYLEIISLGCVVFPSLQTHVPERRVHMR